MVGLAELNGPEPPPVLVEVRRQHNRVVSPEAGQTSAPNAARRAERDYLYPNPACSLRNLDTALYSCQTSLLRTWAVLSNNGTKLSANEASSPSRPSMRVRRFKDGDSFSAECRSRNSAILRGLTRHWLADVSATKQRSAGRGLPGQPVYARGLTAGVAHSRLAHSGQAAVEIDRVDPPSATCSRQRADLAQARPLSGSVLAYEKAERARRGSGRPGLQGRRGPPRFR
jgi:hypothetical protein